MPAEPQAPAAETPFAFSGLDRVFHERARLGIVTSLAGNPEGLPFPRLKRLCGLTDGNLNRHLAVLGEAGYVTVEKELSGKRPQTLCRLTPRGREEFCAYLAALEQVLRQAAEAAQPPDGAALAGKPA